MKDLFLKLVAIGTILVILLALFLPRPSCLREGFQGRQAYQPAYPEFVGRKVAVVRAPPVPKDPETVYFVVGADGTLARDPVLPWAGLPSGHVIQEFQRRFGARSVVSDTANKKRKDRVTVVVEAGSGKVRRVHIPRRWAMAPNVVDLVSRKYSSRLAVALNPAPGTRFSRKTLVLQAGKDGRALSATVRG